MSSKKSLIGLGLLSIVGGGAIGLIKVYTERSLSIDYFLAQVIGYILPNKPMKL